MRLWIWAIAIACIVFVLLVKFSIPDFLSTYLSKHLGVAVSIESFSLRPHVIRLKKVEIANPMGYSLPKAFSASYVKAEGSLFHYLKEEIVLDEILVENIYLGLEFDKAGETKGNWTKILEEKQTSTSENEKRSFFIKRLVLKQIRTQLMFKTTPGKIKDLPVIPEIVLTNISSQGDFPIDQLTRSVLGQMLIQVFIQQKLQNMLQDLWKNPKKTIDKTIKPLKDLFSEAEASFEEKLEEAIL